MERTLDSAQERRDVPAHMREALSEMLAEAIREHQIEDIMQQLVHAQSIPTSASIHQTKSNQPITQSLRTLVKFDPTAADIIPIH